MSQATAFPLHSHPSGRSARQSWFHPPAGHDATPSPLPAGSTSPPKLARQAASPREPQRLADTDQQLVDAIQAGDPRAAAPLYTALRRSIDQALYRVLRDRPVEFEDLVQITFERVLKTIAAGKFEGRSQLKTWASAIATRVAIDHLRRRRMERKLFEAMDATDLESFAQSEEPHRRLEARAEVLEIQGVLKRMKPRRADVLVLHDVLEYPLPQVADLVGLSLSAAASTLRRARQELLRRCPAKHRFDVIRPPW